MSGKIAILGLVVLLLATPSVAAVGIGVSPAKMEFDVCAGESITKTLYVINTGDVGASYEVYADESYLAVKPEEFQLSPGEIQAVSVIVSIPENADIEGYATTISVVTSNPLSDLAVGAGVKIPVSVTVKTSGDQKTQLTIGHAILITITLAIAIPVGIRIKKEHL